MKNLIGILVVLLLISCGPSAEEKAAYEKAKSEGTIITSPEVTHLSSVKIIFTSGLSDTVNLKYRDHLSLFDGKLYDKGTDGSEDILLAEGVSTYSITQLNVEQK